MKPISTIRKKVGLLLICLVGTVSVFADQEVRLKQAQFTPYYENGFDHAELEGTVEVKNIGAKKRSGYTTKQPMVSGVTIRLSMLHGQLMVTRRSPLDYHCLARYRRLSLPLSTRSTAKPTGIQTTLRTTDLMAIARRPFYIRPWQSMMRHEVIVTLL